MMKTPLCRETGGRPGEDRPHRTKPNHSAWNAITSPGFRSERLPFANHCITRPPWANQPEMSWEKTTKGIKLRQTPTPTPFPPDFQDTPKPLFKRSLYPGWLSQILGFLLQAIVFYAQSLRVPGCRAMLGKQGGTRYQVLQRGGLTPAQIHPMSV